MEDKEIGFNTRCEHLKQTLINAINQSNLPIGVTFYILKYIMSEAESTYYGTLNGEAQEYSVEEGDGGEQ